MPVLEQSVVEGVLGRIKREEIAELTLTLAQIDSPPCEEAAVAEFVYDWMQQHDLAPKRIGLLPTRQNIIGTVPGDGSGYSLSFNSHMETGVGDEELWTYREPRDRLYRSAWREGDVIFGYGSVNDKGPMAAWLVAARAIKESGTPLRGDILLAAVCGEIGREPVDEFEAPAYLAKDVGTRYAITHGAVSDFALVAEATAFRVAWVEAGKAWFKLTIFGETPLYTPYIQRPTSLQGSPNAIVRAASIIPLIEDWAYEYEQRNTYKGEGGTVVPKVNIGAIRSGTPTLPAKSTELCSLYVDVRLHPNQDVLAVRSELRGLLERAGLRGYVELYLYRRGYEANNIDPLLSALRGAHTQVLDEDLAMADPPLSSMWRDTNPYIEMGIPALTYGPAVGVGGAKFSIDVDALERAARVYTLVALDFCTREKPASAAAGV